ncbi:MAG: nucleotide exchange factor GrpE [Candidatus Curtissbacteria bacterium]|nr:nucleotide exchange factor GrpE [Candidatus Curtissbacteria bacterium]
MKNDMPKTKSNKTAEGPEQSRRDQKHVEDLERSRRAEDPEQSRRAAGHENDRMELENRLKRALADYQNLERRVEEERRLLGQLSSALLIEKFLPVLDNLENAQKHLNDEGLEIVIRQFKDILSSEGVEEIESVGAAFDPHQHEAAEVQEGENDNTVVKVLRKGYKMNDKVLRPAQVVVEKKSAGDSQSDSLGQGVKEEEVNYSSSE